VHHLGAAVIHLPELRTPPPQNITSFAGSVQSGILGGAAHNLGADPTAAAEAALGRAAGGHSPHGSSKHPGAAQDGATHRPPSAVCPLLP
jgi:hypothetical protein